ncbi:MAG: glycoside hydrolase family 65 [Planctomycetota bacterium]|nr:glycoside hydrolase family 65 [Planctomycetota bacterium]
MAKLVTVQSIDRRALVRRHNCVVTGLDPFSALSVGNGHFAFASDVTGLQTFPKPYSEFPLCTTSEWAWHSSPLPGGIDAGAFRFKDYDTYGRPVGYATDSKGQEVLFNWLRENPHRFHLGRIGLELVKEEGSVFGPEDLTNIRQELDLWTGEIDSSFKVGGIPVRVRTCCHPDLDLLAVRIESPLIEMKRLGVVLEFGYGSPKMEMVDWESREKHKTRMTPREGRADFSREMDDEHYSVSMAWASGKLNRRGPHEFVLKNRSHDEAGSNIALEFGVGFSPGEPPQSLPDFESTRAASATHWEKFWTTGGAIDLSGSTAEAAAELERRIVLSQYLTALHCAGSMPAAETGLLFNSWYGKFHLEMHWWHSVHFTVWNRFELFERSMGYYQRILPLARANAQRQGYAGARWPKMVGPEGRDSPSPVAPLLIWQQPHPIYYAELCYRERPGRQTLDQWRDIVFESANFMASFASGEAGGRLMLGPPLKTVSENTDPRTTINPTFELTYWRFGLSTAQRWRERLGLERDSKWDHVLALLARPAIKDGRYLMQEGMIDTYEKWNWEHPALLGACGMQPGDGIDPETMRRSVKKVMECWQWERAWGWDFPMAAMSAARAGEPGLAVKALMIDVPKNRFHPNGHNFQRRGLTAYLPGNGGLLAATGMMAAGWMGGPKTDAPGFPLDGGWRVRSENMKILL